MIKRLEDLSQDSAAVKAHLLIQIHSLSNLSGELINFGFSVCWTISMISLSQTDLAITACPTNLTTFEGCEIDESTLPTNHYTWRCQILCYFNCR